MCVCVRAVAVPADMYTGRLSGDATTSIAVVVADDVASIRQRRRRCHAGLSHGSMLETASVLVDASAVRWFTYAPVHSRCVVLLPQIQVGRSVNQSRGTASNAGRYVCLWRKVRFRRPFPLLFASIFHVIFSRAGFVHRGATEARDAYIAALCKLTLPAHIGSQSRGSSVLSEFHLIAIETLFR